MSSYGSRQLMKNWYDIDKYFASQQWLEDRPLDGLRPSMQNLIGKKDLVGVEVGVGHGLHSKCLYENLDIKKLYLIDLVVPTKIDNQKSPILDEPGIEFLHGNSIDKLKEIHEELDFVYLDGSHELAHVVEEMRNVYPKLKEGGILAGHDYDQIGVCAAVQTLMINVWRELKEKPDSFFVESCKDNHPGYPEEYLEFGFPLDWWHIKKHNIDDLKIHHLRDG